MNPLKMFLPAVICLFVAGCSSIDTYWYSAPDARQSSEHPRRLPPVWARVELRGFTFSAFSMSDLVRTAHGPIFPIFSDPASKLNDEYLVLEWVLFPEYNEGATRMRGKIHSSSFNLKLDNGQTMRPSAVSIGDDGPETTHAGALPEWIGFEKTSFMRIRYPEVLYARVKTFSFRPRIEHNGQELDLPVFEFKPALDTRWFLGVPWTPFVIPAPR
ncbi:MAG: hypothetical protein JNM27_00080 [Leptospirales bacterium]|nr:hypothetical protein [Leptospirales bacterium]